ncbi:MAG: cupin domain-containing protein [Burkholderiales bacterium]|nr:cupin domain-containing protein [Burkholderiales bacterium]
MLHRVARFGVAALVAFASSTWAAETVPDDQLKWAFIPGIPRPVEVAIVSGDPAQPGPYVVRYRTPAGMKFAPQKHPDDREMTILKGIFWMAVGESYNWRPMEEYKAGTVLRKEAGKAWYGWARTGVLLEERGTGPTTIEYIHEDDDPRLHRRDGN